MPRRADRPTDHPPLDEAMSALRELLIAGEAARRRFAENLGIGMTESWVLSHLYSHGEAGQAELARTAHITTSSMTTLIDRLERADLAERVAHPTDRRRSIVRLTPRGRAGVAATRQVTRRAFKDVPIDLETTARVLRQIAANLSGPSPK
ncbi:MAG: MarR family winged helix-turn-helix transcriptional regulator [Mycobacteriales bacterium]